METLKIRVEGEFDGRKVSLSNVPLAAMTTSFEALKNCWRAHLTWLTKLRSAWSKALYA